MMSEPVPGEHQFVDPELDVDELATEAQERHAMRSDTEDDDRENDEILDGLLRGNQRVADGDGA